jgi:hypothetical protein
MDRLLELVSALPDQKDPGDVVLLCTNIVLPAVIGFSLPQKVELLIECNFLNLAQGVLPS